MRFPIDAVWVDQNMTVLKVSAELRTWRTAACNGAKGVVELPAGEAERRGLRAGDRRRSRPSRQQNPQRARPDLELERRLENERLAVDRSVQTGT
jgi:hypothetical protein